MRVIFEFSKWWLQLFAQWAEMWKKFQFQMCVCMIITSSETKHSLIRGVLIQSCSAGAKKYTNYYVFCHPQFSSVIQNIENCCAIKAKFWKFDPWLYKINYFDNNRHRQTGVKMAQQFSIFWITLLNLIVDDKIHT